GARLIGQSDRQERPHELRSAAIDLSRLASAELACTALHGSARNSAPLLVEYFAADREWKLLDRLAAVGAAPKSLVHSLPADALHAEFAFRFRVGGGPQEA